MGCGTGWRLFGPSHNSLPGSASATRMEPSCALPGSRRSGGITDRLRQVVVRENASTGRRLPPGHAVIGYEFFTDGERRTQPSKGLRTLAGAADRPAAVAGGLSGAPMAGFTADPEEARDAAAGGQPLPAAPSREEDGQAGDCLKVGGGTNLLGRDVLCEWPDSSPPPRSKARYYPAPPTLRQSPLGTM
jgi:hypothetical protein